MSRSSLAGAIALTLLLVGLAQASPPPPPPPPKPGEVTPAVASCGEARTLRLPGEVPATVTPVSPAALGVRNGRLGGLDWRWSVRIAARDARVGGVTSLDIDNDFGLIATTAAGDWLTFDLRGGVLDNITGVGVAPMRGVGGKPVSMAMVRGQALVSVEGRGEVSLYAVSTCGMDAQATPIFTLTGPPAAPVVVDAAYAYVGLVRPGAGGLQDTIRLPYSPASVDLNGKSLAALAGYRLTALSNPARIVPFPIALWTSERPGGGARLQLLHVWAWDDVGGPGTKTQAWDLADLAVAPVAVASGYSDQPAGVYLYLVTDTGVAGAVDIHCFFYPNPPF